MPCLPVFVCVNDFHPSQVWDMVETYDTGCTAGGGKNSMGVFYDAGLLFESNTASGTPYRQGDTTSLSGLNLFPPTTDLALSKCPPVWSKGIQS